MQVKKLNKPSMSKTGPHILDYLLNILAEIIRLRLRQKLTFSLKTQPVRWKPIRIRRRTLYVAPKMSDLTN